MSEEKSSNGMLYFIVGALVVAVLGMGYVMYNGSGQSDSDLSISVSEDGIDVDTPD